MLSKKTTRGKCPLIGMKQCRTDCVFYRNGVRFREDGKDPQHFEDCAINIGVDNLEMLHNRMFMMQKEVGDQKNMLGYKLLYDMGMMGEAEAQRQVAQQIEPTEDIKLIEE